MIPIYKGNSARRTPRLFHLDCLAVTRSHIFGADLAAKRTVILREKATTIGAFVKIGAVKLVRTVSTQHSSHTVSYFDFR